jgi:hypothetical protein
MGELWDTITRYTDHTRRTTLKVYRQTMRFEEKLLSKSVGDGPHLHRDPEYAIISGSTPIHPNTSLSFLIL